MTNNTSDKSLVNHPVVTPEQWLDKRVELLHKEKELTRLRDELSKARRDLPWVKLDKDYWFDGQHGSIPLSQLFGDKSQLIVHHFMFGPESDEGCPSCSFWSDNLNDSIIHLMQRDVNVVAVSRAPIEKLLSYRDRMGWRFNWVSSLNNTFNQDFHVSFDEKARENGKVFYNYHYTEFNNDEAPGISIFYKDEEGNIFHTYSCYARGLDMLNTAYHYLDLLPKGRDEDSLPFSMAWLKRKDEY